MGSVFVWLVAREAVAGLRTWGWRKTECQILRSAVRETDPRGRRTGDYSLDLEYQYAFNGQNYTSAQYTPRQSSFQDYGKVERLAEAYQSGAAAICYVDPSAPSQAVLRRGSLIFPFLILFPLIFVGIGAIGIYAAWQPVSAKPAAIRPISDRARGALGPGFAGAFFGLFMVIGLVVFYLVSVRPFAGILSARHWTEVPCRVVSSEVRTHRANKGNTYSVNILYSYVIEDREYKANRYDFVGGSSSGFAGKQAIVNRYPPRSNAICYVDPNDPTAAVLERGFTPMMWIGLLPLIFVLLGFVGLVSTIRKRRSAGAGSFGSTARLFSANSINVVPELAPDAGSAPLVLRPRSSPASKFIGWTMVALFWNGIISVFLLNLLKSSRAGYFEWFLGLFLIPFVLVGLGLLVAAGYSLLASFNPRPQLTLVPGTPRLGDSVRLEWEIRGRVQALENLQFRLEGREEVTYTNGDRSATDRNVFASLEIVTTSVAPEIRSGSANVAIPAALMHSFAGPHNKIIWSVQVKGAIARWPDLNEEFALSVLPAANRGASL